MDDWTIWVALLLPLGLAQSLLVHHVKGRTGVHEPSGDQMIAVGSGMVRRPLNGAIRSVGLLFDGFGKDVEPVRDRNGRDGLGLWKTASSSTFFFVRNLMSVIPNTPKVRAGSERRRETALPYTCPPVL